MSRFQPDYNPSFDRRAKKIIHDFALVSDDCFKKGDIISFYKLAQHIQLIIDDAEAHNEFWHCYFD